MAKKIPETISPKKLALYEKAIAEHPEIERKGASVPYTSHNGHMFSFYEKNDFAALRLSKEVREAFIEKYDAEIAVSHGAVMNEYVVVPDALLAKTEELATYFAMSLEYIKTLKPKPTKKPKK